MAALLLSVTAGLLVVDPPAAVAAPAVLLRFVDPTPAQASLVPGGNFQVRVAAPCAVDPESLRVELDGRAIPSSELLPFGPCADGRMLSRSAPLVVTPPEAAIRAAPHRLDVGEQARFVADGDGDRIAWTFGGGAPPAYGAQVRTAIPAAGRFRVQARALSSHGLNAIVSSGGRVLRAARSFTVGDASPDERLVEVAIARDVDYVNFESSQVHPLALAPGGERLLAVNTPEARLEVLDVSGAGTPLRAASIRVGLEPVSVALRPGTSEAWVVNQLSDSVSVVDLERGVVVATLDAPDEPSDVVFAAGRAFVSAGGRDDVVRVYDAGERGVIADVPIFGDGPRALAASPDGSEVYVVVLRSGNGTTVRSPSGTGVPAEYPPHPPRAPALPPEGPFVGLIVRFDPASGEWQDELGIDRGGRFGVVLPDRDLFVLSTGETPAVVRSVSGVGTTLLDALVNPATGHVWVPNTEAHNVVRFLSSLRGRFVDTRVSVVDPTAGDVVHVNLNPHVDRTLASGNDAERAQSLSQPGHGVFRADGAELYLTAFGSRKVAVLDAEGAVTARIDVGAGPSGVALDEARGRLYVLNRLEQTISVVDIVRRSEIERVGLAGPSGFDPSPHAVRAGREAFYDARSGSAHGDVACASCHLAGGADGLAWDLGDPDGDYVRYADAPWVRPFVIAPRNAGFDPMKGPMVTQTLRGLLGTAPFHWRADRPDLLAFNASFVELQGRASELDASEMQQLADFLETLRFPPSPFRLLDDGMPASIQVPTLSGGLAPGDPRRGETLFTSARSTVGLFDCVVCHAPPTGESDFLVNFNAPQEVGVPQLRALHEKLDYESDGREQKRGFGVLSDGGSSLARFLGSGLFRLAPQDERDVLAFLLAWPGDAAAAVGHQVTIDAAARQDGERTGRIATMLAQAERGACDVVVSGARGGVVQGFTYDVATRSFVADEHAAPGLTLAQLVDSLSDDDVLTFTGVPPGSGVRAGVDRDRDGWRDATEAALAFDPADPTSNPWGGDGRGALCRAPAFELQRVELRIEGLSGAIGRQKLHLRGALIRQGDPGPAADPERDGMQLLVEDLGSGAARIFDLTEGRAVPPGAIGTGCDGRRDGWSANRDRNVFRYANRSGLLAAPACGADALGLRSLRLTRRSGPVEALDFAAHARGAALAMPTGPLRVTLVLGSALEAGAGGGCATRSFDAARCAPGGAGGRYVCR